MRLPAVRPLRRPISLSSSILILLLCLNAGRARASPGLDEIARVRGGEVFIQEEHFQRFFV